jgi:hypothetical protein
MSTEQELTQSDRGWLDHLRRAHAERVTLVEYARAAGLKVGSLYEARRTLQRKGVRVPGANAVAVNEQKPAGFVPVRVLPAAVSATTAVCRLRHGSGWVIECASWPDASWLTALLGARS